MHFATQFPQSDGNPNWQLLDLQSESLPDGFIERHLAS
jgi:hypothetical protein